MLIEPSIFPVEFNVSHTRWMALIAVTQQHPVGIDVEWIDQKIQDREIAERFFSEKEATYLTSLSPVDRTCQFFSYWTCKEAYLKMHGKGIAEGLGQSELCVDPHHPKVRLSLLDQQETREDCSMYQIKAGPEHVGAVAIACPSAHISYWNWQDDYLP